MRPGTRDYEEETPSRRPQRRAPGSHYQVELGTNALLALFFALAIVCGMFFAFGYTLGKHAIPASFTLGGPGATAGAGQGNSSSPAPGVAPPNPSALGAAESDQTPQSLTATPSTTGSASGGVTSAPTPAATTAPANPAAPAANPPSVAAGGTAAAGASSSAPAPAGQGPYNVQVFAGMQTDANSLAAALGKRGYPVTVVPPGPGETNLYRVTVGPYLTQAEAQAMRSRLKADGYQAVIKQ